MEYYTDKQLAARFSVKRETIWLWSRKPYGFPRPVKISPGTSRWRSEDIAEWESKLSEDPGTIPTGAG